MHRLRFPFVVPVALALMLAACTATPGQSPADTNGGEPSAAGSEPAASQPGGNGGNGGGENGSVQYEITGDYTDSGELRFVPEGSYFEQNGSTSLTFTSEDESTILVINLSEAGEVVQFGNTEATVINGEAGCEFNLTRNDATGAAGTFDCPDAFMVLATGSQGSGTIRGTFEAHI